ncbi:putative tetratricopeptide (TRP) repeat protein [Chlamydiales bacterium STE3]|nr:putative tetratricopeptide (TRP) repeat protein [Chlamydiales bacterium STE3]
MQLLEKEKKLSESLLWRLQDNAYTQFGPQAWSQKGVPFYVTSNPYTACSYAQVVFGYLKDCPIDFNETFYLFDLGAGTGRFAYLFLKEFERLIEKSPFAQLKFCYVMTDLAKDNFAFWQNHLLLKKYFAKGVLDYSYYRHTQSQQRLVLEIAQKSIDKPLNNPIVLFANYFFDTIPQDLFRFHEGRLQEGLVSLYTSKKWPNADDPEIINDLSWEFSFFGIDDVHRLYTAHPYYRELIQSYKDQLRDAVVLFPIGAMQVLDFFKEFSSENMLLLAGDQGVATLEQIKSWQPKLALHGSFSIPVSYHTLSNYFLLHGGKAYLSQLSDPAFVVMAGIFSRDNRAFYEAENAFKSFIDAFEPQDYWRLGLELEKAGASLEAILLLIKLGKFDPMNLYGFYERIRAFLPSVTKELKQRVVFTLEKVFENFFPVAEEDGSFIANLGVLFFELQEYQKALDYFQQAMIWLGEKDYLLHNMNQCKALIKKT